MHRELGSSKKGGCSKFPFPVGDQLLGLVPILVPDDF